MVENPYIGRVVVLLTPVFAGLSGWIATRAAEILPGMPKLEDAEMTSLFVAGALTGIGAVYKWLDNRGKYEQAAELNGQAAGITAPPDHPQA